MATLSSTASCSCAAPFRAANAGFKRSSVRARGAAVVRAAQHPANDDAAVSRRVQLAALLAMTGVIQQPQAAQAIGFKKELKRRKIPIEEYSEQPETGLKIYDLAAGKGDEVAKGSKVTVHFDVMYKGIDVVSSRSSITLGGNRTVAEPFEFVAGNQVTGAGTRKVTDRANGLFAGEGGLKPPVALSTAVLGMKVGGKRSVIVPPELAYGDRGEQEIPPGATVELQVEVLSLASE